MLIDNDKPEGVLLRRVLDQYALRHETTAAAGLAAAYFWHPDLLLIDTSLPDVDGTVLAKQIQSDPLLRRLPIVFLSSKLSSGPESQPTTLRGCPAFGKAFDMVALRRYVDEQFQLMPELAIV